MTTVLAYLIVILLVQFALTIGVVVGGTLLAFLLIWTSERVRVSISSFVAGVAGVVTAVLFGYLAFRILVGSGTFGLIPFLASTMPLIIPILNDHKISKKLNRLYDDAPTEGVRDFVRPAKQGFEVQVFGEIIGVIISFYLFHGMKLHSAASAS